LVVAKRLFYLQVYFGREKKSEKYYAIKALRKDQLLHTNCADCVFAEKYVLTLDRDCSFINSIHSTFTINVRVKINITFYLYHNV